MKIKSIINLCLLFLLMSLTFSCSEDTNKKFSSYEKWESNTNVRRHWAGPEFWLNPLQAWLQEDGYLKCITSGGERNIVFLTHELNDKREAFTIEVNFTKLSPPNSRESIDASSLEKIPEGLNEIGWIGFQIGLQGQFNDYRDNALYGKGLGVGVFEDGSIFIGNPEDELSTTELPEVGKMVLNATPYGEDNYQIQLKILDNEGTINNEAEKLIHKSWIEGSMAIICSQSLPDHQVNYEDRRPSFNDIEMLNRRSGGDTYYGFNNIKLEGRKISNFPERKFGPILWAQYTVSDNILKMSVQMAPIGNDNKHVQLKINGEVYTSTIDSLGRNALFRVENWDMSQDLTYVVTYESNTGKKDEYSGIIKKSEPEKDLKVASLSCVDDRGFPHQDIVNHVADHAPDIIIFHGDQLYERSAGYGVERNSILDYQRKWYIFGWSFGPLLRDRPGIIIPDDHDVFHGNLWGEGGKAANVSLGYGYDAQDDGGYKESPEFVNMVHRTQTGHLPDPYDPTPVQQDISVYYTNMNYGGVSFAILGDRQWKSAPKGLLPDAAIENGWPQDTTWDPKTEAYHPEAHLLGERQEKFLEDWAADWENEIYFKVLVSQSPFCNVATLPAHIWHDKFVPNLPKYKIDEYPNDDRPVADFDSNGWPQNKRNKALKTIRKAAVIHLTGDQHLGSTGEYGIDEYGDAGYWVATPAVANLWPRRWYPAKEADSGKKEGDTRRYTGDYEDGFGNKITVLGIANPHDINREPSMVFDKAPGYAIINFKKESREIDIAVWPRWASPKETVDNQPFPDWPITINQLDNLGTRNRVYLDEIQLDGEQIVSVRRKSTEELIYRIRPPKGKFRPFVFDGDEYIVELGEDSTQ